MKTLFSYIVILFTALASMFFCQEANAQKIKGSNTITSSVTNCFFQSAPRSFRPQQSNKFSG